MKFELTGPCSDCPFRTDRPFFLTASRAVEIGNSLVEGAPFACHKTTDFKDDDSATVKADSQHCAGALIVLERSGVYGQCQQIAESLGLYDKNKLEMDAPVFNKMAEFIKSNEEF